MLFRSQLDEMRKKEDKQQIIEADMDDKIIDFKDGDKKQVMDINVKSQEYDTKKGKDYKEAEEKSKMDTDFWDRYVGVQLEDKMKKIDNNLPAIASQLPNKVERFKKEEPTKMIMASLKDADAMLLHIHAKANSQNRELTEKEKQQVIDINSGKMRLIAQMIQPIKRSLEYSSNDPIIRKERDGSAVVYDKEKAIDKFKSCGEAKANYPEADEEN